MTRWINWTGGKCPVAHNTPTEIKFRFGMTTRTKFPQAYFWDHCPGQQDIDIVAYRWNRPNLLRRVMASLSLVSLRP